jgi:hypothetical protein
MALHSFFFMNHKYRTITARAGVSTYFIVTYLFTFVSLTSLRYIDFEAFDYTRLHRLYAVKSATSDLGVGSFPMA